MKSAHALALTALAAGVGMALAGASIAAPTPYTMWERVLLDQAREDYGAACIDGSSAAYYIKWGVGDDVNKWIIFWEGGGWCTSLASCYDRSKTPLGSSHAYPPTTTDYSVRDLLNPNCTINPRFCQWTTVYAPYCDGQSRAGNAASPATYNGTDLYFRGYRNLNATITQLLHDPYPGHGAPTTLATASHVLISGSSAGGLTTYLHADYIASRVAKEGNASAPVKAVPEVGFFIDGASVWGGAHLMTEAYTRTTVFANITGPASEAAQVNAACLQHYRSNAPDESWKCFMAQYTYPFITLADVFIVNSKYDEWQLENILAPNPDISFDVGPWAPWEPCIKSPSTDCNATQYAQFQNYSTQFMTALNASRAAQPSSAASRAGGFITSCDIHTTMISGLSHRISIGGKLMYDAVAEWVFEDYGPSSDQYWTVDGAWPHNPTCAGPHIEAARGFPL